MFYLGIHFCPTSHTIAAADTAFYSRNFWRTDQVNAAEYLLHVFLRTTFYTVCVSFSVFAISSFCAFLRSTVFSFAPTVWPDDGIKIS